MQELFQLHFDEHLAVAKYATMSSTDYTKFEIALQQTLDKYQSN